MSSQPVANIFKNAAGASIGWGVVMIILGLAAIFLPAAAGIGISVAVGWIIVLGGFTYLSRLGVCRQRSRRVPVATAHRRHLRDRRSVPGFQPRNRSCEPHIGDGRNVLPGGGSGDRYLPRIPFFGRIRLGARGRNTHSLARLPYLAAMAQQFGLGDRDNPWHQFDHQWHYSRDVLRHSTPSDKHGLLKSYRHLPPNSS